MSGPSENPSNASPATASGTVIYDDALHTLSLQCSFSGLTGNVTQTHFHAVTSISGLPDNNPPGETLAQAAAAVPNAGIAIGNTSLPNFPLNVTSGTYSQVLDLTNSAIYNTSFLNNAPNSGSVAAAEATFVGALTSGKTYWNIHSSTFGGGELRGFPVLVPEPTTLAVAAIGMAGLCIRRRRS
jgi:hypothetical protein